MLADPIQLSLLCGFKKPAGTYKESDVQDARRVVAEGERLMGTPSLHGTTGISRNDLSAAEAKVKDTEQNHKSFASLNSIEPGVQESWQVPHHRAHLKERSDAEFYKNCAQLLLKGGDKEWADELTGQANRVDKVANKELAEDSSRQHEVFYGTKAVTPAKLELLKEAADRVQLAMKILPNVDERAVQLLKAIDPQGHGVTNAELDKIAKNPQDRHLSHEDIVLLRAVAAINEKGQEAALDLPAGTAVGSSHGQRPLQNVGPNMVKAALKVWAQGELRDDDKNPEKLFFSAIEGYNGRSLDPKSAGRFVQEMESKDGSQLIADRKARDYNRVPHFPPVKS
jgi:hypothetical protein